MAMLAEKKQKNKYSQYLMPNHTSWTKDESKFGQKLLEKMGWSKGKGLGKDNQGLIDPIKPTFKSNNEGMGYKDKTEEWVKNVDAFEDVLTSLGAIRNPEGVENDKNSSEESNPENIESLEQKSKSSKNRVHYKKFTRGKDLSLYKEDDLASILGSKKSKRKEAMKEKKEEVEENVQSNYDISATIGEIDKTHGLTTIHGGNLKDYFNQKMTDLKKKRNEGLLGEVNAVCNSSSTDKESAFDASIPDLNFEPAKREFSFNVTVQEQENLESRSDIEQGEILLESKKKKKKKDKKRKRQTESEIAFEENFAPAPAPEDEFVSDQKIILEATKKLKKKSKKKKNQYDGSDDNDCYYVKEDPNEMNENDDNRLQEISKKKEKKKKRKREYEEIQENISNQNKETNENVLTEDKENIEAENSNGKKKKKAKKSKRHDEERGDIDEAHKETLKDIKEWNCDAKESQENDNNMQRESSDDKVLENKENMSEHPTEKVRKEKKSKKRRNRDQEEMENEKVEHESDSLPTNDEGTLNRSYVVANLHEDKKQKNKKRKVVESTDEADESHFKPLKKIKSLTSELNLGDLFKERPNGSNGNLSTEEQMDVQCEITAPKVKRKLSSKLSFKEIRTELGNKIKGIKKEAAKSVLPPVPETETVPVLDNDYANEIFPGADFSLIKGYDH